MNEAGLDALTFTMGLSSRSSICSLIVEAQTYGEIAMLVMTSTKELLSLDILERGTSGIRCTPISLQNAVMRNVS